MRGYNRGTRTSTSLVILVVTFTFLFLNLLAVVTSSSSRKCATLYNAQFHRGTPYSLTDGDKRPSLRGLNFVPSSAQVSTGCVLTIFDVTGNKKTVENDLQNLGWNSNSLLDAACCECDSCRGAANQLGSLCARLYENLRCDSCSGFRLDFKDGDNAKNFGVLNNKMTSVAVRSGCTLTVFYEKDFLGWRHNFTGPNNMMRANWIRQISSAKCGCSNDKQPVPTSAPFEKSTWPPVTFPTASTRRPSMTQPTILPVAQPTVSTRPPMTLPTVPPVTRPTVTSRSPVTLPTVPTTTTTTTKRIITLPTVPPSEEELYDYKEPDYYLGGDKSSEISESTTSPTSTTTVTQPSSQSNVYGFEDEDENDEIEENEDEDDEEAEEEDEDAWGWDNWSE